MVILCSECENVLGSVTSRYTPHIPDPLLLPAGHLPADVDIKTEV